MMSEEVKNPCGTNTPAQKVHKHAHNNAVYGLGLIGAAIYYIGAATTFWTGVLGFLKALVWPAFLVYEWMKHLGM